MTKLEQINSKYPLLKTALNALILGALLSIKMMATGLVFVVIFLLFWLPYSLYVIVRYSQRRKAQAWKIGIWIFMIAAVLAIHQVRKVNTRDYADSVVLKIEQFRQQHGRYPDSLAATGLNTEEIRSRLGMPHYSNKPLFYYPDTIMVFHMWQYDFDKRVWIEEYD